VLKDGRGGFKTFLFGFIEVEFEDGLDAALAYDAGRAEADVMEAVLACQEG
jgi:ABC-type amino acid transport substrate-binding protein